MLNDTRIKCWFIKNRLAVPTPAQLETIPAALRERPLNTDFDRLAAGLEMSLWIRKLASPDPARH